MRDLLKVTRPNVKNRTLRTPIRPKIQTSMPGFVESKGEKMKNEFAVKVKGFTRMGGKLSLLACILVSQAALATQLAVLKVHDGLLVAGNEAETEVFSAEDERTVEKVCKVFPNGNRVGMVIGMEAFNYGGKKVGSLRDALRQAINSGTKLSFDRNKAALEKAYKRALLAQIEAKKRGYHAGVPMNMKVAKSNFILAMYEDGQFKTAFVTVSLVDWDHPTFSIHEWPFNLDKTNLVQWFEDAPKASTYVVPTTPLAEQHLLQERMNAVYMGTREPFHAWVQPPYVIGKLTNAGFAWVGNPDQCASVVFQK